MFLERSCIWFFRKSGIAKVYWLPNTLIYLARVLYERKNSNKSSWSYVLLSKLVWQWPMWLCRGSSNTSNTSIFSEALSSVGATAAVIYSSSNSVFWISTTMCDIGQVVRWYYWFGDTSLGVLDVTSGSLVLFCFIYKINCPECLLGQYN